MSRQVLLVSNKGTDHELSITYEMGSYFVDNVYGRDGRKVWTEFPRVGKTVTACKAMASRILGEKQKWEAP